jgi:hypothetical protein
MAKSIKSLVIQNDSGKIKDLRALVNVALNEAQKAFKTRKPIIVKEIFQAHSFNGWVVVLEWEARDVGQGRIKNRRGEKGDEQ